MAVPQPIDFRVNIEDDGIFQVGEIEQTCGKRIGNRFVNARIRPMKARIKDILDIFPRFWHVNTMKVQLAAGSAMLPADAGLCQSRSRFLSMPCRMRQTNRDIPSEVLSC